MTASDSNATSVTTETRPTFNARRPGVPVAVVVENTHVRQGTTSTRLEVKRLRPGVDRRDACSSFRPVAGDPHSGAAGGRAVQPCAAPIVVDEDLVAPVGGAHTPRNGRSTGQGAGHGERSRRPDPTMQWLVVAPIDVEVPRPAVVDASAAGGRSTSPSGRSAIARPRRRAVPRRRPCSSCNTLVARRRSPAVSSSIVSPCATSTSRSEGATCSPERRRSTFMRSIVRARTALESMAIVGR